MTFGVVSQTHQFASLFAPSIISCRDGDGTCYGSGSPFSGRLDAFIDNGIPITPIQLFHYASVNYRSRWGSTAMRWITAYSNAAVQGCSVDSQNRLILRPHGDHELRGQSSEVIGVGLSTFLMCKALNAKLSRVEKIDGTSARCDYYIKADGFTLAYESRGRTGNSNSIINKAVKPLPGKKAATTANYKFGVVTTIPKDGSCVGLHLFDPPGEEPEAPSVEERYYVTLKHYRSLCNASGLFNLAAFIDDHLLHEQRRVQDMRGSNLSRELIEAERRQLGAGDYAMSYGEPGVLEARIQVIDDGSSRPRRERPPQLPLPRIGVLNQVHQLLANGDLDGLYNYEAQEYASFENRMSIANDGSMLIYWRA